MKTYKIRFESNLGIAMTVTFKAENPSELQKKITEYQTAFPKQARHLTKIDEI